MYSVLTAQLKPLQHCAALKKGSLAISELHDL
jgi:hypothetical protein